MANMWLCHRDPSNWSDPDTFLSTRWSKEGAHDAEEREQDEQAEAGGLSHYYHPFSLGPRGCPGQSVAFMLCRYVIGGILQQVELHPSRQEGLPKFKPAICLPNTPLDMRFECTPR